jgi:hypothetical protein
MTFSELIPIIAMILYFIQACIMLTNSQYGFAIMWFAYGMANVGIIMASKSPS